MSYCPELNCSELDKKTVTELNQQLDKCENCTKYHICDTVAFMLDKLKVLNGELLQCPYCEEFKDFCDCPDLFYEDETHSNLLREQYKLSQELVALGFNLVTCGNCGEVFIHRIEPNKGK